MATNPPHNRTTIRRGILGLIAGLVTVTVMLMVPLWADLIIIALLIAWAIWRTRRRDEARRGDATPPPTT